MPFAVSVSSSSSPCGKKTGRERWGGRTRGKRRGYFCCRSRSACRCHLRPAEGNEVGSGERKDAGQTERRLEAPIAVSSSLPSLPCGRKRSQERWGGRTRGERRGRCRCRLRSARHCPPGPAEENEVESGGEGGRGANEEDVGVTVPDQLVVAVAALRKETRSGAVERADAGQT